MIKQLEHNTLQYWRVSSAFNGRIKMKINVSEAMMICNDIMYTTGPHRKVNFKAWQLQEGIIQGKDEKSNGNAA